MEFALWYWCTVVQNSIALCVVQNFQVVSLPCMYFHIFQAPDSENTIENGFNCANVFGEVFERLKDDL